MQSSRRRTPAWWRGCTLASPSGALTRREVRFCDCERLLWGGSNVSGGSKVAVREISAVGPEPAVQGGSTVFSNADNKDVS
jgi:hypothetical protein